MNFLSHLMRLHKETPVRIALKEVSTQITNGKGRPKRTWLKTIVNDLAQGEVVVRLDNADKAIQNVTYA